MIRVIDVSAIQQACKWDKVAAQGIRGAYLRCTVGMGTSDARFAVNARDARSEGVAVGAYHFAKPSLSPGMRTIRDDAKGEMLRFFSVSDGLGSGAGEMPPAIDIEIMDGLTPEAVAEWLVIAIEEAETLWKRRPLIYTGAPMRTALLLVSGIEQYDLWIAGYPQSPPRVVKRGALWSPALTWDQAEAREPMIPRAPWPWGRAWRLWQFSGGGPQSDGTILPGNAIPGILDGNSMPWTDCNRFNGGEPEWRTFLGIVHPPETGPHGYEDAA